MELDAGSGVYCAFSHASRFHSRPHPDPRDFSELPREAGGGWEGHVPGVERHTLSHTERRATPDITMDEEARGSSPVSGTRSLVSTPVSKEATLFSCLKRPGPLKRVQTL